MIYKLFDNYSLETANDVNEFSDFFSKFRPEIFSRNVDLRLSDLLSDNEKDSADDDALILSANTHLSSYFTLYSD